MGIGKTEEGGGGKKAPGGADYPVTPFAVQVSLFLKFNKSSLI